MLVNICMKFHEDTLKVFVTERTHYTETDNPGKNDIPKGGDKST